MRLKTLIAACLTLCLAGPMVSAQDPFAPILYVNDSAITRYELDQRVAFMRALNTPGDVEGLARKVLIENRLQVQEATRQEIELTDEQLAAGIAEFAARGNMTTEQFTAQLAQRGVDPQTVRDFIRPSILWREVVRARYGIRVDINAWDVDIAMSPVSLRGGLRLLLSEIIIPAPPEQTEDARALAEELSATIRTEAQFTEAAMQFSASPSAPSGGRIDWLPAENLPPPIANLLIALAPGQVTAPIQIPNAIALFQLRGIEETGLARPAGVTVSYAQVFFPDTPQGLSSAQAMRDEADGCNDLYALARGMPPDQLVVTTLPNGQVPQDIGLQLARLDPGETTLDLRRGGTRVLLMLCSRVVDGTPPSPPVAEGAEPPPPETMEQRRERMSNILFNQRLGKLSDAYLQSLVANAIIREP